MDWIKLISDISAKGATQKAMADRCRCGQSTISEIARGEIKNPAYSTGKALLDYYDELAAEERNAPDRTQTKAAA